MNFKEIQNAVKYLKETCTCLHCKGKYKTEDIHIIATTKIEGLFEIKCKKCKHSTLVNVLLAPEVESKKAKVKKTKLQKSIRNHKGISHNDILDTKNFLAHFDGNFKKIFSNNK